MVLRTEISFYFHGFLWSSKVYLKFDHIWELWMLVSHSLAFRPSILLYIYSIYDHIWSICHIPVHVWSLGTEVINTDILFLILGINKRLIYSYWSNWYSEVWIFRKLIFWHWSCDECDCFKAIAPGGSFLLLSIYLFVYSDTMTILYFLWFTICNYFRNLNNLIPMICQPKPTQMTITRL